MGSAGPDFDGRLNNVASAEKQFLSEKKTIQTPVPIVPIENARYVIAKWVIIGFVIYVGAVGLYIMCPRCSGDLSRVSYLTEMAKTLLLPLTTLAIGFHFGSAKTN
jgi:hypothetical protein